jgi:hypothetical protein
MTKQIFFAYPATPDLIGETIERSITAAKQRGCQHLFSWRELDIPGHFIATEVLEKINLSDILFADITHLNFNVVYEIGYAIGKSKRVYLVKNSSVIETSPSAKDVGVFDTIGYDTYQNSDELRDLILNADPGKPIPIYKKPNIRSPLYVIETKHRTDWQLRLISRIKKTKYLYQTFDPNESPRLSAIAAIDGVSQSFGVIIPLLPHTTEGYAIHNMRAAFIAGLASGMEKIILLIQNNEADPIPLDYRDFVKVCLHPDAINDAVADFAADVNAAIQSGDLITRNKSDTSLQRINLGASSAENEIRSLDNYYLRTDAFLQASRGEAHLVVGRKGSGKSAIFLRIRDEEQLRGKTIVLDLQPEGYKLIKFKESILRFLEAGTFQHTIMAFWEYVLLLEICHKILWQDRELHIRNHELYEPYQRLAEAYKKGDHISEGDFSERMSVLMDRITNEYHSKYGSDEGVSLSSPEITHLIHSHDIRQLTECINVYLKFKDGLWLLFDNIDKGWPTSGIEQGDLVLVRTLLDATRKLERQMTRYGIQAKTIIFLRNDVYQLLVKETSDRGKEASVLLDWTDPDLLREMLRLRIAASDDSADEDFFKLWTKFFVSHVKGEESSQYLIERSLMRPRFLLDLISQCKGFAINLNHKIVEESDIEKGISAFSTDLVTDIGFEIQDIDPDTQEILYLFIGSQKILSGGDLNSILEGHAEDTARIPKLIELLLWYGFLGLVAKDEKQVYIYDVHYNLQLLLGMIRQQNNQTMYYINPAFWSGLLIE